MKALYTFDDLAARDVLDRGAELPARLAVIGHPVAHSASPTMHQAAINHEGIAMRYIRLEIAPGRLAEALDRLRALDFVGCNVTVPHKFDALMACDQLDPGARALGAVNTIAFAGDLIRGYNTDGPGFELAVRDEFGARLGEQKTMILGAGGGAGQALAAQSVLAGVPLLVLANRSEEKLVALLEHLRGLGGTSEIVAVALDDPRLEELSCECELVVNATSLGLKAGDRPVIRDEFLNAGQRVYDTIYQPPVTPLLAAAAARGCATANGLGMLLHQGALAFEHWFPGTHPLKLMREALNQSISQA
ncbi:MAG: shikimate dehydrogenase [Luteolibacter sp.]